MTPFIKAENITVDFPIYGTRSFKNKMITSVTGGLIKMADRNTFVRAINNVSFEFQEGERIGLLGHNGSGKTTLLRVMGRIYTPTGGRIRIEGKIASLLNISLGMNPEATGIENIYLRATMMGLNKAQIAKKIDSIVEFTELGDFINLPMRTYSSGMQMRLGFAVSTCVDANIILMDEWLSVGDNNFKAKAQERLKSLLSSAKLLVIASHDKNLLNNTCNRIINMQHGQFINDYKVEAS